MFKEKKVVRGFFETEEIPDVRMGSIFTFNYNGINLEIFVNRKECIGDRLLVMGYFLDEGQWYLVDILFVKGGKGSIILSPKECPSFAKPNLVAYRNKMLAKLPAIEENI